MKKFLITCLTILFLALVTAAIAAGPYVVSDPDTEATRYRMRLSTDGSTWGAWTEAPPVNNAMKFDVAPIPRGDYEAEAQAAGETQVIDHVSGQTSTVIEWSTSAPFALKKKPGRIPTGIKTATD